MYLKDEFEKSADDVSIIEEIVNERIKETTVNPRKRSKDISEVTVTAKQKVSLLGARITCFMYRVTHKG